MDIRFKYFGKLTDITNCNDEVLKVDSEGSLSSVIDGLYAHYPKLKESAHAIFINNKKAELLASTITNNDEIVLMPPFAGG